MNDCIEHSDEFIGYTDSAIVHVPQLFLQCWDCEYDAVSDSPHCDVCCRIYTDHFKLKEK